MQEYIIKFKDEVVKSELTIELEENEMKKGDRYILINNNEVEEVINDKRIATIISRSYIGDFQAYHIRGDDVIDCKKQLLVRPMSCYGVWEINGLHQKLIGYPFKTEDIAKEFVRRHKDKHYTIHPTTIFAGDKYRRVNDVYLYDKFGKVSKIGDIENKHFLYI